MFETLFKHHCVLRRHKEAPFAASRAAYLSGQENSWQSEATCCSIRWCSSSGLCNTAETSNYVVKNQHRPL